MASLRPVYEIGMKKQQEQHYSNLSLEWIAAYETIY